MSVGGAFSAASAGSSNSGSGSSGGSGNSSSSGSNSGTTTGSKSSAKAASWSSSYSTSSNYSVSRHSSQTQSSPTKASSVVNVNFNAKVNQSPAPQNQNLNFKESTREQLALKNEKSQALYANQKNWEHMRDKIAAKALPMPTYERDYAANRNIDREYSDMLKINWQRIQNISVNFDTQIKDVRVSSDTLSKSFERLGTQVQKAAPKTQVGKYKRPKINNDFNDRPLENGRGR